jgi:phage-related protein
MAANIVGDAYVVVRAITAGVEKDIKNAFKNSDKIGRSSGERVGDDFQRGFKKRLGGLNLDGSFAKKAKAASDRLSSLVRTGYLVGPALSAVAGTVGVLITSLTSLASVVSAATLPALATLAGALTAVGLAAITAKLAFSGVAKAVQAGNKAAKDSVKNDKGKLDALKRLNRAQEQLADTIKNANKSEAAALRAITDAQESYNETLKEAREQLQQLAFDSEDAAINEQKAALDLEKARETLARVSDLPPNSRARKEAELAFAEADLNYRRAIDANNDLKTKEAENAKLGPDLETQAKNQKDVLRAQRDTDDALDSYNETLTENAKAVKRATEDRDEAQKEYDDFDKNTAAANAYADALSDLSAEAQHFVKYIVSLKDEFKALKAAAGEKLFPQLETAIQNLVDNLFPRLKPLLTETGDVLGKIAVGFSKTVTSAENMKRLESIWKTSNVFLEKMGTVTNNLYEVFLILLDAAKPLIDAFGDWLVKVTGAWKQTLILDEKSGKLAKTFETAKGILKDLGTIFGNVFGGFGKIISANVGPGSGGQIFLDYLKDATGRFKNIQEIDGKPLKEFFAGAAENGTKLLSLLGNIGGEFIKLADDEGLGIFYDKLSQVVDIFGEIGGNLNGALPALGDFLIAFANITKTLTESGSIVTFFDVLTTVINKVNDFLKSDLGQSILDVAAKVLPLLLAFKTIFSVVEFGFLAIAGPIFKVAGLFAAVGEKAGMFMGVVSKLGVALGIGTGPVLAIIAAVAAFIAIFVIAYTKSENLREAVGLLIDAVKGALMGAFNDIKGAIQDVMPVFEGVGGVFKSIGDFLAVTLVPILGVVFVRTIGVVSGVIQKLIYTIGGIIEAFKAVWNFVKGIFQLLTGNTEGAAQSMKKSFESAFNAIKYAIKAIVSPFVGVLNAISDAWNNSVGKFDFKVPSWVPVIGGKTFSVPNLPRINLANFADGGIVAPRDGGLIARVAEAGKPERIEPLDPDGLSKRDKAMIDYMGGSGKGVTVNVYPSAGMDERELAAIVSRQLAYSLRKGAA